MLLYQSCDEGFDLVVAEEGMTGGLKLDVVNQALVSIDVGVIADAVVEVDAFVNVLTVSFKASLFPSLGPYAR